MGRAIIATEFLGFLAFKGSQLMVNSIILPMIISTAGAIASILAIFHKALVSRYRENATVSKLTATTLAGLLITVLAIVILSYFTVRYILGPDYNFLFWSSLGGVLAGFLIGLFTLIYTDSRYRPTRNISESAKSGPATLVVNGLAYGMESTLLPALYSNRGNAFQFLCIRRHFRY